MPLAANALSRPASIPFLDPTGHLKSRLLYAYTPEIPSVMHEQRGFREVGPLEGRIADQALPGRGMGIGRREPEHQGRPAPLFEHQRQKAPRWQAAHKPAGMRRPATSMIARFVSMRSTILAPISPPFFRPLKASTRPPFPETVMVAALSSS